MIKTDLLIHSAAQLLTVASPEGPKKGAAMGELGIIEDGAVAVKEGRIALAGKTEEVQAQVEAAEEIDASGKVVMPSFVDPHTHLVFAGSREDEFKQQIRGATYMELMAGGGGIMNTVRATRKATLDELVAQSRKRLDAMLAYGTTTAEAKTGYGLDIENELKILEAIRTLDRTHPVDVIPTFLGARAIPDEYAGRPGEYLDFVIEEMLPRVTREEWRTVWEKEMPAHRSLFFCDVYCEEGAFTLEESRRLLTAARDLGLGLKIHADEFSSVGGAALAAELGATTADHLVCTPPGEIESLAEAGTIAVLLPGAAFGLGWRSYANARAFISAEVPVALATDINPGTCWCESMQLIIALACRQMGMTPAEAIVAATINAAHAIGLGGEEVGSLEVGKKADIILLDVPNYSHLAYRFGVNMVEAVIKEGKVVERQ